MGEITMESAQLGGNHGQSAEGSKHGLQMDEEQCRQWEEGSRASVPRTGEGEGEPGIWGVNGRDSGVMRGQSISGAGDTVDVALS